MRSSSSKYFPILIVILLVGAFPLILRGKAETINQALELSATIVSSLAAFVTLWIALLLFNKYGIDSTLIDKSSSKVFDLLEFIKSTRFSFGSEKLWFNVGMSDPFKNNNYIEGYYKEKLIFPETYINSLKKIFETSSSPFMPAAIADKVDRLQFYLMSFDVQQNAVNGYLKVFVMGDNETIETKFGRFNGEDLTVFEFLTILEDIRIEVEKWVGSHSVNPVKLNL